MDPFTLFALANGAVNAVKAGCKLYKDIKGAANDVKGVLKDLDEQFHAAHKEKPATPEQKKQYVEERIRVVEISKMEPRALEWWKDWKPIIMSLYGALKEV